MFRVLKRFSIVLLLISVLFVLMSCGGRRAVPLPGNIPNEVVFEEQLGVLPEEAEELMTEVDKIENDVGNLNPFQNPARMNSSREIVNETISNYLGAMRFGPYPYFKKYNLEVLYILFEQGFVFENISGSMSVNYYISDQFLGNNPTEADILGNTKLLTSLNVEASGEQTLSYNSNSSEGAKDILAAINESIQNNTIKELYVYVILTFVDFDDQFIVTPQAPTLTFTVDLKLEEPNQNPTIQKTTGPEGETNNTQSEFSWDGNDPDGNINSYIISKDGATETTKNKTAVWAGYTEGQHTFKVKGIDNRNGVSNELTWTFTYVPNPNPTIQKVSGPDGGEVINENSATFEWTGNDDIQDRVIEKYQIKKDNGDWEDNVPQTGTTYDWNDLTEGAHTFSVRAVDDEGANSQVLTWTFTYEIPLIPYTLTVEANPAVGGDIKIGTGSWKDTDETTVNEGTQVEVHARAAAEYTFEGWYQGATKLSNANPYTVTVDADKTIKALFEEIPNVPPTVEKEYGPDNEEVIYENTADFEWNGNDTDGTISKYQCKKDDGDWTDMNPLTATTFTWDYIPAGDRTFSVKAIDNDGDPSEVITWTFTYVVPNNPQTLTVEASPTVGGDVRIGNREYTDTDDMVVEQNTQVQIQAQPANGYTFEGWYKNNVLISEDNPYTVTVDANMTIKADFVLIPNPPPTVQKTSGPDGGDVINVDSATFEWTGNDEVGARVVSKYQYKKDDGVWLDMNPLTATTYTWNTLAEGAHTFSVKAIDDLDAESEVITWTFTYTIPEYTLTVQADPTAGGDIRIEAQGWADEDTITVDEGTEVDLSAQTAVNYQFDGWYDGVTKVSEDNPYTVTVDADQTLKAKFSLIPQYTLTVQANPAIGGSIKIEEEGWKNEDTTTVNQGTEVEISAQAVAEYQFDGWFDGATKISEDNPYTVTVNADQTIKANFSEIPNTSPTVQKVDGPGANIAINNADFEWSGNDTDGTISKYQYKKDEGTWTDHALQTTYSWSSLTESYTQIVWNERKKS